MIDQLPALAVAIVALYFVAGGVGRIVRRKRRAARWHFVPPHYAVREEQEQTGWHSVLGGIWRIILGGSLILLLLRLLR